MNCAAQRHEARAVIAGGGREDRVQRVENVVLLLSADDVFVFGIRVDEEPRGDGALFELPSFA